MQVDVVLDGLFTRKNGKPASNNTAYIFYTRYLSAFAKVNVVARCFDVEDSAALPVAGKQVSFVELPGYQGPKGFIFALPKIAMVMYKRLKQKNATILRLPATIPAVYGLLLWTLRRPYAVELVGDPEDGYSVDSLKHPLAKLFCWVFTNNTKFLCKHAVVCSYVTSTALQAKYPARQAKNMFAYTSLDLPTKAFVLKNRNITKATTAPKLLQVAMMQNFYKGHDVSLQALKILHQSGIKATLTLVGNGPLMEEIKFQAQTLGVLKNITFMGLLPAGEKIWAQMDKADLLILPSRQEGLPRVVIEAMARSLPCVASRVGGIPELLDKQQLMDNITAQELAKKVTNLLSNPALLTKCSQKNLVNSKQYGYTNVSKVREKFYQLVKNKS